MNNVNFYLLFISLFIYFIYIFSLMKKYRNLKRDARNSINLKLKKLIKYYQI